MEVIEPGVLVQPASERAQGKAAAGDRSKGRDRQVLEHERPAIDHIECAVRIQLDDRVVISRRPVRVEIAHHEGKGLLDRAQELAAVVDRNRWGGHRLGSGAHPVDRIGIVRIPRHDQSRAQAVAVVIIVGRGGGWVGRKIAAEGKSETVGGRSRAVSNETLETRGKAIDGRPGVWVRNHESAVLGILGCRQLEAAGVAHAAGGVDGARAEDGGPCRGEAVVEVERKLRRGGQREVRHGQRHLGAGDGIIGPGGRDLVFAAGVGGLDVGKGQGLGGGAGDCSAVLEPLVSNVIGIGYAHVKEGIVALQECLRDRLLADADHRGCEGGDLEVIHERVLVLAPGAGPKAKLAARAGVDPVLVGANEQVGENGSPPVLPQQAAIRIQADVDVHKGIGGDRGNRLEARRQRRAPVHHGNRRVSRSLRAGPIVISVHEEDPAAAGPALAPGPGRQARREAEADAVRRS